MQAPNYLVVYKVNEPVVVAMMERSADNGRTRCDGTPPDIDVVMVVLCG